MKPTPFDIDLDTLDLSFAQKQLIKQFVEAHIIGEDKKGEWVNTGCPDFEPGCLVLHRAFQMTQKVHDQNEQNKAQRLALYGIKEQS